VLRLRIPGVRTANFTGRLEETTKENELSQTKLVIIALQISSRTLQQ
jgi:hypothetical protein